MTRDDFQRWLDGYVAAWKSYDPQHIGALFSDDAVYGYSPEQKHGLKGRQAIVDSWLENRDEPGTYAAHYEPLAIEGDVHVAHGSTRYFDHQGKLRDEYYNVYVCRFNGAGECTAFTEYWMQNSDFRRRDREELVRKAKSGEL